MKNSLGLGSIYSWSWESLAVGFRSEIWIAHVTGVLRTIGSLNERCRWNGVSRHSLVSLYTSLPQIEIRHVALMRSRLGGYTNFSRSGRPAGRPRLWAGRPPGRPGLIFFFLFFLKFKTSNLNFDAQTTPVSKSLYMKFDQKNETDAMAQLP